MLQQCSIKSMSAILQHGLHYQLGKEAVRPISNSHVANPASGFDWLFECAPSFYIDGNNVQVLEEPSEFYNTLKVNYLKHNVLSFGINCFVVRNAF